MAQTLEQDISAIEELDKLRVQVERLKAIGLEQLRSIVETRKSSIYAKVWAEENDEPNDFIAPALIRRVIPEFKRPKRDATDLRMIHLFEVSRKDDKSPASRVPIFAAARVLHALLESPETFFSPSSMCCYYRIVRELFAVEGPNLSGGGIRATTGGVASAFMTGECTRALAAIARSLTKTAQLIEYTFTNAFQGFHAIKRLSHAPESWKFVEYRRLALAAFNVSKELSKHSIMPIPDEGLQRLASEHSVGPTSDPLPGYLEYFSLFCHSARVASQYACEGIQSAIDQAEAFHQTETAAIDPATTDYKRLELSHAFAYEALRHALETAEAGLRITEPMQAYVQDPHSSHAPAQLAEIINYAEVLRRQANRVRLLMARPKEYLESVLDREVEKAGMGRVNAGELAFAAAAYAAIQRPQYDPRLERAAELLAGSLSLDGSVAQTGHLDTDSHGYSLVLNGSEVLRAMAQVFECTRTIVDANVIQRMLTYFDTTAVKSSIEMHYDGRPRIVGWTHDRPRHPVKAYRWASALAILALARIGRMLDRRINTLVLRHFSVLTAAELRSRKALTLSRLCYPDFGLAAHAPAKVATTANHGQSVAFLLERMRAHVNGLHAIPGYGKSCHSLILFGPPGTGKTTLVEAVAASSYADLVQITPSDFLLEGEAFVERRARLVFRALSCLTKCVILFDEFEQILRSRDQDGASDNRSVFSFLTPGMLPKLKDLNVAASKRQTAYCLVTNHIGSLDNAAMRAGRFDHKVGIYPPDALSRAGLAFGVVERYAEAHKVKIDPLKVFVVVSRMSGVGMELLAKPGNLVDLKPTAKVPEGSLVKAVLELENVADYDPGVRELTFETFASHHKAGLASSVYGAVEFEQWNWIDRLDQALLRSAQSSATTVDLAALARELESSPPDLMPS